MQSVALKPLTHIHRFNLQRKPNLPGQEGDLCIAAGVSEQSAPDFSYQYLCYISLYFFKAELGYNKSAHWPLNLLEMCSHL